MQFANPLAIRPKESDRMFPGVLSAAGPESDGVELRTRCETKRERLPDRSGDSKTVLRNRRSGASIGDAPRALKFATLPSVSAPRGELEKLFAGGRAFLH
jgi:hypothetical protein